MILDTLVNGEVKLSKSEKWIALSVLNNPTKVINQSITSLAEEAGVSLPTVNRFCKKLGFDVEVINVRDATEEELAHKHAHGIGGHHHD